jgi:hypothetical protein
MWNAFKDGYRVTPLARIAETTSGLLFSDYSFKDLSHKILY